MSEESNQMLPQVLGKKSLCQGKALAMQSVKWQSVDGATRSWESVERVSGRGAVLIIPRLVPSGRLVLIRQFRPPVGGYVVEFPAGLIDAGESPETAAFRELLEETGYHGAIVHMTPPTFNSPGLTNETVCQVVMDIDEERPENQEPAPTPEGSEHIEELLVPRDELVDFIDQEFDRGGFVDSKVVSYILGGAHE